MAFAAPAFPLYPRSRRMQSALTFFRHGLFDTLAMSPLAHHVRPHRHRQRLSHSHSVPSDGSFRKRNRRPYWPVKSADRRPRIYLARAAKAFGLFAAAQQRCSASNPEDIGLAGGDPIAPSMSPLRAVGSRGHIAPRRSPTVGRVALHSTAAICESRPVQESSASHNQDAKSFVRGIVRPCDLLFNLIPSGHA